MYAYIEGSLVEKEPAFVVVDVGGVGYELKITLGTYSALKSLTRAKLFTYSHIKEDAHTLYGFFDQAEKRLFMALISISGVGPATGIMMLSSLSPDEIHHAILTENVPVIQGVKGVGAKTAQRIILELKDKVKKEALVSQNAQNYEVSHNSIQNEALSALVTLGINKNVAEKAIINNLRNAEKDLTVEELIKRVLKSS
ncbi:MAG: Holliday junction branch migration protein RuvA [Cyclobacteriaceae bacterium]|nr:Holliday junction branch migration protein RuvA [Cyclobacteriaceae bacterium]